MANILHVEDDMDMGNIVKLLLKKRGHTVISAANGKEGLTMLKKQKVDLVLLDVMLPDISGWDVYDKIRKDNKNIKVAFLTIVDVPEKKVNELVKKGVADYIKKPFSNLELIDRVTGLIDKKKK